MVLLGLPGAGKGTQGELISEKYHIPHISTGSIIRSVIAAGSPLGVETNRFISQGNLVPDPLIIEIVKNRLLQDDCRNGWILDGFPRTVKQARDLDLQLASDGNSLDVAIDIRIDEDESISRIEQRRMCRNCGAIYHLKYYRAKDKGVCDSCGGELYRRADDTVETAKKRLAVYMQQTHPVLHYYAQDGRLYSIDGQRPIDEVFSDVDALLRKVAIRDYVGDQE